MDSEDFKEYRQAQQKRRAERLPIRVAEIMALTEHGYTVKKLTEYQYRVNDAMDIFPIHARIHFLKPNSRTGYKPGNLLKSINNYLNK